MLFPISNVPIAVEFMKRYSDPLLPCAADRTRSPSREVTQHVCSTLQYVWRRIPAGDRRIMLADMAKYKNRRLSLWFVRDWLGQYSTNAFIKAQDDGVIAIDLAYASLADKRHLGATLAHELGHYRDFAEGEKQSLTEGRAKHYAENAWGFPQGEVILKCEACRYIDSIVRKQGISGNVFWHAEIDSFVYFRHGQRIHLRASGYQLLHDEADNSLDHILTGGVQPSFRSKAARSHFHGRMAYKNRHYAKLNKASEFVSPAFYFWKDEVRTRLRNHPALQSGVEPWLVRCVFDSPEWQGKWQSGETVDGMVEWAKDELESLVPVRGCHVA